MRIGIDARFYGKAGPGRYTKNIIKHLEEIDDKNTYFIFLKKESYDNYIPKNTNFTKVLADYPWYSFAEQLGFLLLLLRYKLDLYYVPHFNIPVLYPGKIVTAIPDMTMHSYSTERGTTLPLWYFRVKKYVYKIVFWWAVKRSYKVIVPSYNVLGDFMNNFTFSKSKYIVAYEGIDPDFYNHHIDDQNVLDKYGVNQPYILSIGSMYEHKNVPGLIEAFKILITKYKYPGQLVLASKLDKFSQKIYEDVKMQKLDDRVLVIAYKVKDSPSDIVVSDDEITSLRKKADLYTMVAFKEGFSLTALEGMLCGLPAVLSGIECHKEVYGDSVLYCDPYSPEDIAQKINEVLTNKVLRDDLKQKGFNLLKKYNWLDTAKITLSVFNNIVKDIN